MIEQLIEELAALPQIEAIALGGSRASGRYDEGSDYDIYLYCTEPVPEALRRDILKNHCTYMEIGNAFWEYEDNGTLNNGIDFDLLYRDLDNFCEGIAQVVEECQAHNGYTTCMWHNLLTCQILYDRDGRLTEAKQRFSVPYPRQLKANILDRNWKLLRSAMPAYELQIKKAVQRTDFVSINHRVSAFLESYFDILFALNGQAHPGEKRLMSICLDTCSLLPDKFQENLHTLFGHMFVQPKLIPEDLDRILTELTKIM